MTRPQLDVDALHEALDQKRRDLDLSWRQVAKEVGIASSTFTRMTQGKRPDVDSFAALIRWLGVPAETFLGGEGEEDDANVRQTFAVVSTHLKAGKNLSPKTADALKELIGAAMNWMLETRKGK